MADTVTAVAPTQAAATTQAVPTNPPAAPAAAAPQQSPSQPSLLSPEPSQKAAEPVKEAPKPPAEIKLTVAKDSLLQQAQVDKIAAFARERGLSQEVAQAAADMQAAQLKEFADGHLKGWQDRVAGWRKELEAHKEFGGERLKEFDAGATEVVMKYGGQGMMQFLKESGYSSHPEVAQFLWNIHKAMRPDKIVAPQAASVGEKADLADRLFPTSARKA